jgi:diacylglycerol kinase (ATP)
MGELAQFPGAPSEHRASGRRIRIIWNPDAGSKAGVPTNRTSPEQMRELMARFGLGEELVESTSEEHAMREIRAALEAGYDVIVGAGGDGTVGLVARQLIGTDTALGILPLGSAMNIARSLEIPRELEAAAEILASGEVRAIDIGVAIDAKGDATPFFEAGSVGISAAVFAEAQRIDGGEWGGLLGLFRAILQYRPRRMELQLDDQSVRTRAMMVVVANGPYTGIGLAFAPHARLDDGLFDVRLYRHFSRGELIRHVISIVGGRRRYHPKVATYRSARVRVESVHRLPARADSHDLGTTPVTYETRPGALRVIVPRAGATTHDARSTRKEEER